jgi:8-oxo-dGTP diphosphatase
MDIIEKVSLLSEEATKENVDKIVVGIFVQNKNSILVLKRLEDDSYPGMYEIPGGGVEMNEEITDAIIRELKEETSLEVSDILLYINSFDYRTSSGKLTRQFNFLVKTHDIDVKWHPEHQQYKWITEKELSSTPMTKEMHSCISNAFQIL